jgi:hypothetical protein
MLGTLIHRRSLRRLEARSSSTGDVIVTAA